MVHEEMVRSGLSARAGIAATTVVLQELLVRCLLRVLVGAEEELRSVKRRMII